MINLKNSLINKILPLILLMALLFGMIAPITAFAADKEEPSSDHLTEAENFDSFSFDAKSEIASKLALGETLFEIESLREENIKHFRNEDGTFTAVVYADAVHRKNSDGTWRDIDNNLSISRGLYTDADGRISFASQIGSGGEIYTYTENGYSIALAAAGAFASRSSVSVQNPVSTTLSASKTEPSAGKGSIIDKKFTLDDLMAVSATMEDGIYI